jgi:hypothetical protein
MAPGLIVHVPVAGNPVKTTLPVAVTQVGCVIVLTIGADGGAGCELITMFAEASEVQPDELETV